MKIEILSREAAITAIGEIRTSARELAEKIHVVAYTSLVHVRDHGDTSLVVALLNAMPQRSGVRAEALAEWFRRMSSKAIRLQASDGIWSAKASGFKAEQFLLELAEDTSPFMLTKEKPVGTTFTVDMLLKKLRMWADEKGETADGKPKVDAQARALASRLVAAAVEPQVKVEQGNPAAPSAAPSSG